MIKKPPQFFQKGKKHPFRFREEKMTAAILFGERARPGAADDALVVSFVA